LKIQGWRAPLINRRKDQVIKDHPVEQSEIDRYLEKEDGLIDAIAEAKTNLAMRLINTKGVNIEKINNKNSRPIH
jgi:hypothetical protein